MIAYTNIWREPCTKQTGVAGAVALSHAFIMGFAVVLYRPFTPFPLQLPFFHLLSTRGSLSFTVLNNDIIWDVFSFSCKMKILILSLPLHNALTIRSLLSACEATLQGN